MSLAAASAELLRLSKVKAHTKIVNGELVHVDAYVNKVEKALEPGSPLKAVSGTFVHPVSKLEKPLTAEHTVFQHKVSKNSYVIHGPEGTVFVDKNGKEQKASETTRKSVATNYTLVSGPNVDLMAEVSKEKPVPTAKGTKLKAAEKPAEAAPDGGDAKGSKKWRSEKKRLPRKDVLPIADSITAWNKEHNPGVEFHFGGSFARGEDSVGDLDTVFITPDGTLDGITFPPNVKIQKGGNASGGYKGAQGDIEMPDGTVFHVDFWSAKPEARGGFLWYITGPKELNVAMRKAALKKGWHLPQQGLFDGEGPDAKQLDDGTQESIAKLLGGGWEDYIEPTTRKNWGKSGYVLPAGAKQTAEFQVAGSKPGSTYTVKRDGSAWSCTCPAYKFGHGKPCKHIGEAVKTESLQANIVEAESQPAPELTKPKAPDAVPDSPVPEIVVSKTGPEAEQKSGAAPTASSEDAKKFLPMTYLEVSVKDVPQFAADDDWVFQQKIDGIRGTLVVEPGKKPWFKSKSGGALKSGTAQKISDPLVKKMAVSSDGPTYYVDGELLDGYFNVFDMVVSGHKDMPWEDRMALAEQWVASAGLPEVRAVPTARTVEEKIALWDAVNAGGGEGVVIKRRDSKYTNGRTKDILKAKIRSTADVVVMDKGVGFAPDGSPKNNATFGIYVDGKLTPIGAFSLLGKEKKEKVEVGDVVEISYLWAHPESLNTVQPVFERKRPDKKPEEATDQQLRFVDKSVLDAEFKKIDKESKTLSKKLDAQAEAASKAAEAAAKKSLALSNFYFGRNRTMALDDAIDNLLSLAGSEHVSGYNRQSKSGKTVHVDAYWRTQDASTLKVGDVIKDSFGKEQTVSAVVKGTPYAGGRALTGKVKVKPAEYDPAADKEQVAAHKAKADASAAENARAKDDTREVDQQRSARDAMAKKMGLGPVGGTAKPDPKAEWQARRKEHSAAFEKAHAAGDKEGMRKAEDAQLRNDHAYDESNNLQGLKDSLKSSFGMTDEKKIADTAKMMHETRGKRIAEQDKKLLDSGTGSIMHQNGKFSSMSGNADKGGVFEGLETSGGDVAKASEIGKSIKPAKGRKAIEEVDIHDQLKEQLGRRPTMPEFVAAAKSVKENGQKSIADRFGRYPEDHPGHPSKTGTTPNGDKYEAAKPKDASAGITDKQRRIASAMEAIESGKMDKVSTEDLRAVVNLPDTSPDYNDKTVEQAFEELDKRNNPGTVEKLDAKTFKTLDDNLNSMSAEIDKMSDPGPDDVDLQDAITTLINVMQESEDANGLPMGESFKNALEHMRSILPNTDVSTGNGFEKMLDDLIAKLGKGTQVTLSNLQLLDSVETLFLAAKPESSTTSAKVIDEQGEEDIPLENIDEFIDYANGLIAQVVACDDCDNDDENESAHNYYRMVCQVLDGYGERGFPAGVLGDLRTKASQARYGKPDDSMEVARYNAMAWDGMGAYRGR